MKRRPATPDEARALAHPLRLRILRLCLDQALTNKQLAGRLGENPATVLHHVRTLERTGFLVVEEERAGPRGSREKPYRATGKSWTLDVCESGIDAISTMVAMVDAFRAEVMESPRDGDFHRSTRLALRLAPADRDELAQRVYTTIEEFTRRDHPDGEPIGLLFAIHQRPPVDRASGYYPFEPADPETGRDPATGQASEAGQDPGAGQDPERG